MYIKNPKDIPKEMFFAKPKFLCRKIVADYLIEHNIPLFSKENDKFIFVETDLLKEVISNAPVHIKAFLSVETILL